MTVLSDADLYLRGAEALLASWEEYARGAAGAVVRRSPGVAAAVFHSGPERAFYHNAVLQRDLGPAERGDAIDAMQAAYAAVGVSRFAAWVHESDHRGRALAMGADLAAVGPHDRAGDGQTDAAVATVGGVAARGVDAVEALQDVLQGPRAHCWAVAGRS